MVGYIFGGSTGETPESLKRKREIAQALLAATGSPRNVGEGLNALGSGIAAAIIGHRADKAEKTGQESASGDFNPIIAALGGGGAFPVAPGAPQSVDMPTQRVASAFGDQPGPANGYFDAIRSAESGGSDSAKNPRSSATGRYQFTKGTWDGLMTAHPELGLTPDGRTDPAQQERAIRVFTAQNAAQLQDAGIQPTGGNLYAAHFLGAGGAKNVLTQPDNAAVSSFVGPEVVKANPFLANMTVGQFKQWAAGKGGGSVPVAFSEQVPANSSVAMSGPPTQPAQAPNGAPGQLPDAEALKLLGASPVTRDAQGGPSIAMLLRSAANPWTNKNESAVVQALLKNKLDPNAALETEYKRAQIDNLKSMAHYRNDPNARNRFGNNVIWGQNADGNWVAMQPTSSGGLVPADVPDGIKLSPPGVSNLNLGTQFGIRDRNGQVISTVPIDNAGKASDTAFGKGQGDARVSYNSMVSKLPGLETVVKQLDDLANDATYTTAGQIYNLGRKELGLSPTDAAVARTKYMATVANQILPLLRDTFGAQFTAREGDTLMATMGDPNKTPAEKQAVLKSFIDQKKRDIESLARQTGQTPPASVETAPSAPKVRRYNPQTGELE